MEKSQALRLMKERPFFLLVLFLLFFLPPDNFYEQLRIKNERPLIRETVINLPSLADYPLKKTDKWPPTLSAKAVMVVDIPSQTVLLAKNPDLALSIASITKIMTALIVLENFKLDQILTVPSIDQVIGRKMSLLTGEKVTVKNLLYGLLIQSANDAAYTLASNYSEGIEQFIYSMNQKAKKLNLFSTHFANISGIDQENHYSTARNLVYLAAYSIRIPVLAKMVKTKEIIVSDVEQKHWHKLENTNQLVGEEKGVLGIKTGWTEKAGECLVAYAEKGERKVITVVLGSQDRFGETRKLIHWVFDSFQWQEVTPPTLD